MKFLARKFKSLQHLSTNCPQPVSYKTVKKTQVAPLEILDINESTKDGNIQILEQFARDVQKSDAAPVVTIVTSHVMIRQ